MSAKEEAYNCTMLVKRKDAKLEKDTAEILDKLHEERDKLSKRYQKTCLG